MSGYTAAVVAVTAIASSAYAGYSSVQAGKQANLNAEAQSDQAQIDADNAASAAEVQADRIRRVKAIRNSEATAALAGSGVDVGEGTALNINEEITRNAEEDAALTVFNGQNQKKRGYADASNYELAGGQAQSAANSQAVTSVLGGATSAYTGWKASAKKGA